MPNVILFTNYTVIIKAIEIPMDETNRKWAFSVQFFQLGEDEDRFDNTKEDAVVVEIPSMHGFPTAEDAIQDAFGIIELYGFTVEEGDKQPIEILDWDYSGEDYISRTVLFDGFDFYPDDEV